MIFIFTAYVYWLQVSVICPVDLIIHIGPEKKQLHWSIPTPDQGTTSGDKK